MTSVFRRLIEKVERRGANHEEMVKLQKSEDLKGQPRLQDQESYQLGTMPPTTAFQLGDLGE